MLWLACWGAAAGDVSPEFTLPERPSVGHYTIEFLPTLTRYDQQLETAYQALANLEFEQAYPLLVALVENPNTPRPVASEAWMYLGYLFINKRRSEEAVKALQTSLELNPERSSAHFFLAQEYYFQGDRERVMSHLQKAVELRPHFVSALRMMAEFHGEDQEYPLAVETYEKIVELLPNSGYYWFQLYRAQLNDSQFAASEKSLLKLIELEPNFDTNYVRLGELYLRWYSSDPRPKLLTSAEEAYQRLLDQPDDFRPYLGLARVELARDQVARARQHLRTAAQLKPDSSQVEEVRLAIERYLRDRRKAEQRRWATTISGLVLALLVVFSSLTAWRRQSVLEALARFNARAEEVDDFDGFRSLCQEFFSQQLQAERVLPLLYLPHDLALQEQGQPEEERDRIRVITGEGVASLTHNLAHRLLRLDSAATNEILDKAFPSLSERLRSAGYQLAIPLTEGPLLRGLLALSWKGRPPALSNRADLLRPLSQAVTQVLERLHLVEVTMHDEMTGLANRRAFNRILGEELRRAARYRQPCSVLLFDLDDFKQVNDTYGHPQGDRVLVELAELLKRSLREGIDTAARIGGEEFAVILPATPMDQAMATAERLRALSEKHRYPGFPKPHPVTLSIGCGTFPDHARGERDLVKLVDEAQYLAKRGGKNRVCAAGSVSEAKGELLAGDTAGLNIVDRETGLFNASYLGVRLADELRRSARTQLPLSVVVMALDGWKSVKNKRQLMTTFGSILKKNLREGIDLPSALREHEVAILLPETELENAFFVAERIRTRAQSVFSAQDLTLSGGVTSFPHPQNSRDPMALLESAYSAYRRASKEGNSIFCTPTEEDDEAADEPLTSP